MSDLPNENTGTRRCGESLVAQRGRERSQLTFPTPLIFQENLLLLSAALDTLRLKTLLSFFGFVMFTLSIGCLFCFLTYFSSGFQKDFGLNACGRAEPRHKKKQVFPVHSLRVYNVTKYPATKTDACGD